VKPEQGLHAERRRKARARKISVIEEIAEEATVKKLEMILVAAILRRTP
jgi:hypothetical protein